MCSVKTETKGKVNIHDYELLAEATELDRSCPKKYNHDMYILKIQRLKKTIIHSFSWNLLKDINNSEIMFDFPTIGFYCIKSSLKFKKLLLFISAWLKEHFSIF